MERTYLGDGVYLDFNGIQLILIADNKKVIYLERDVANSLKKFIEQFLLGELE